MAFVDISRLSWQASQNAQQPLADLESRAAPQSTPPTVRLAGPSEPFLTSRHALGALAGVAAMGSSIRRRKQRSPPPSRLSAGEAASEADYSRGLSTVSSSLVVKRLSAAESSLQFWGYVAETAYSWLGLISLGIAAFSSYSQGPAARNSSSFMGVATVGLSVLCGFVGWFQSRMCRQDGRRCGLAAASFPTEPSTTPTAQLTAMIPQLGGIESLLQARQRTAWLGMLFSVVGLQAMVGLLVAKVLSAGGGLSLASGFQLDVFTLLAVSNTALSHVIGVGVVAAQRAALPASRPGGSDAYRGWDRQ
mmetsp:Transcript_51128/g.121483  ORF Transcript_51128/g.121483 Transcript_51128/m.121483 type:complete len:306 (+) Transcript_51128:92-1009(+)